MKRTLPIILVCAAIVTGSAVAYGALRGPAVNPDPNHTHADFAVWVNGTQLDFSDDRYMSVAYVEGQETPREVNAMRKFLHLHDGNGHVIHRHKPALTLDEFFGSIDNPITANCMTLDDAQYASLDSGWKEDFAILPQVCTNGKFHWQMYVNGAQVPFDPFFAFNDTDKILLVYSAADMNQELVDQMTDDACLYSRTCPWRGDPPTENCIADPTVPCVAL